jgi:hypothetical protein
MPLYIGGNGRKPLALAQTRPAPGIASKTLRLRKVAKAVSGDKTISTIEQGRPAMCCCQIPPYDDFRTSRCETAGSSGSTWMSACFVAGVTLLSLSLATGIWIAVTA